MYYVCMYVCTVHMQCVCVDPVGSVLLPSGGRGGEGGCFIEQAEDTTVSGFTIYYPNQLPQELPQPYPWWV